nr:integrase core domain-containing protein [Leptospira interrogans]
MEQKVDIHFTTPGRSTENAFIESCNGKMRNECLNKNFKNIRVVEKLILYLVSVP